MEGGSGVLCQVGELEMIWRGSEGVVCYFRWESLR